MQSSPPNDRFDIDPGPPLPNFQTTNLDLRSISPAIGIPTSGGQPDYLIYDQKSRSLAATMFKNTGFSYLFGIIFGSLQGINEGLWEGRLSQFRVQVNALLNNTGRSASKAGNLLGVISILYSTYEHLAEEVRNI